MRYFAFFFSLSLESSMYLMLVCGYHIGPCLRHHSCRENPVLRCRRDMLSHLGSMASLSGVPEIKDWPSGGVAFSGLKQEKPGMMMGHIPAGIRHQHWWSQRGWRHRHPGPAQLLGSPPLGDGWCGSTLSLRAVPDTQEGQKQTIHFTILPGPASGSPSQGSLCPFILLASGSVTSSVIPAWRTGLVWYPLLQWISGCVARERQMDWATETCGQGEGNSEVGFSFWCGCGCVSLGRQPSAKKWACDVAGRGLDSPLTLTLSCFCYSFSLSTPPPPTMTVSCQWSWGISVTFLCGCPTPCSGLFTLFQQFLPHPAHILCCYIAPRQRKKTTLVNPPYLSPRQIRMNCSLLILMQIFTSEWEHLLLPLSEGHFSPCLPVELLPSKNILVGFSLYLESPPYPHQKS